MQMHSKIAAQNETDSLKSSGTNPSKHHQAGEAEWITRLCNGRLLEGGRRSAKCKGVRMLWIPKIEQTQDGPCGLLGAAATQSDAIALIRIAEVELVGVGN